MPHTEYDKEKVEEHKMEIQRILGALHLQSSSRDESPSVIESATLPIAPVTSGGTITASGGMSSAPTPSSLTWAEC